ncbi:hypothetical protein GCWU000342_00680 [Shuttleworthella satelles DSM 14600]|uniref:Uncharacterized protein n=1 Tax=Shuttleworthella satelles DSM 14600 TaxID=626523 RepID=C4G9M7_9FIRM|nr:hypothetical protein GCWU000342_00680 [Shuttleworthia satelles DSM 14600]
MRQSSGRRFLPDPHPSFHPASSLDPRPSLYPASPLIFGPFPSDISPPGHPLA